MIQFLIDAQCDILEPLSSSAKWLWMFRLNQHQRFASYRTLLEMPPYQNYPKLLASSVTPVQGDSIPLFSSPAIH
jgi:hypothetical protein